MAGLPVAGILRSVGRVPISRPGSSRFKGEDRRSSDRMAPAIPRDAANSAEPRSADPRGHLQGTCPWRAEPKYHARAAFALWKPFAAERAIGRSRHHVEARRQAGSRMAWVGRDHNDSRACAKLAGIEVGP